MTKKMTLTDTFTIAELNTVITSMRGELKNDIESIKDEEIDTNDIEDLTERLKQLTVVHDILDLFDGLVGRIAQGLEELRDKEPK